MGRCRRKKSASRGREALKIFKWKSYAAATRLRGGVVEAVAKIEAGRGLQHENEVLDGGKVAPTARTSKFFDRKKRAPAMRPARPTH